MGVPLDEVFLTLQLYLGGYYTNDFNQFGRTWQVNLQGDPGYRLTPDQVRQLKVRNANGEMVPLGSVAEISPVGGPALVIRYNGVTAAAVNGGSLPGRQLRQRHQDGRERRQNGTAARHEHCNGPS